MPLDVLSFFGGVGLGIVAGAVGSRLLAQPARGASPSGAADAGPVGPECLICGRLLPIGGQSCPTCNPVAPPLSELEATLKSEYRPLKEVVPLAGLSRTAQQVRDVGARGYLHVFTGKNKGESILLGKAAITIGRAAQNTLVLSDEGVSQNHAEVHPKGDGYAVKDLGSRNGTFVNDQRVEKEKRLAGGDIVAVGDTKMLFQG